MVRIHFKDAFLKRAGLVEYDGVTKGTKEWATSNINFCKGCTNGCLYCYARANAYRFGRIKKWEDWENMEILPHNVNKGYGKRKGRIMMPTTHDITIENMKECIIVLNKILKAGNEVLITTKPIFDTIDIIHENLGHMKKQIQYRFTITSNNEEIIREWEPHAPMFEERLFALKNAYQLRYKTSISIEPFLDEDPLPLIAELLPYVTESIWIGPANHTHSMRLTDDQRAYLNKIHSKKNLLLIFNQIHKKYGQYI